MIHDAIETVVPPRITVLVAAWNEENNIDPFIQSYLELSYPNRELVLCAGGNDGTFARANRYTDQSLIVLEQHESDGKQGALRRGFEYATGTIIVLTDADCILTESSVERLIEPILQGECFVTTGLSKPKSSQLTHPFVYYQHAVQDHWQNQIQPRKHSHALLGRNCAISRSILKDIGAFDENIYIGTDSFLAKKVLSHGLRIHFVPDSVVETEFPTSLLAYCRQRSRWRRNAIIYNIRFRQYRRVMKALRAPIRALALFVFPLLCLRFGRSILYAWFAAFAYAVFLRIRQLHVVKSRDVTNANLVYRNIPLYILADWAAQVLSLIEMLSTRSRRKW